MHLPVDDTGLELAHLYSTPRLALLPGNHPLAERAEIAIGELADDPVVPHAGASPVWEHWHNVDPRPDGRRPRRGPAARNLEEKIEVVGTGRAISFIPASVLAGIQVPPEVTAIPVADIPPAEVCLAWKSARRSRAIRDLVTTARTTLRPGCHATGAPRRGQLPGPVPAAAVSKSWPAGDGTVPRRDGCPRPE